MFTETRFYQNYPMGAQCTSTLKEGATELVECYRVFPNVDPV